MFITKILQSFRSNRSAPAPVPVAASVDIELPLVASASSIAVRTQLQSERLLSQSAQFWLTTLPASVRPRHLADQFPRIANRLGLVWRDAELVDRVLDELLVDKRGGRRGFPSEVSAELLRLHAFHERRRQLAGVADAAPIGQVWDRHLQASADH